MARTRLLTLAAAAAASALLLTGCVAGENSGSSSEGTGDGFEGQSLNIDFATYNPLSLIIKDQGWLEAEGLDVTWIQSAGSNKANEALRAGAIDVGSTAGSAALLARANGSTIKLVDIYSQPEWSALVTLPENGISSVDDLVGRKVAATKGTDPYFFLLQALEAEGVAIDDITVENVQHADGWAALQNGSVDAWAGLDPIMAGAEVDGAELFFREVGFNSYGALNATEDFIENRPELLQLVIDAYESARVWAQENPEETAEILAEVASLDVSIAQKVIDERSNLDVSGIPGQTQLDLFAKIGPVFVELGDVATQEQVDEALATLIDASFAEAADSSRFGAE
ncbi:ABC transporter substrate-binding protein [Agromyces rhizosphaerae]|uniref:ABC transporter substrate-binding protein n=1 Tax=Agromyces rhizosphaerae TaxID=88374 RepID=A0A9W6CY91_9MICO|nr:aliphatic sulfonate ABC transporter substrate-binding protein [Agromyces rhizosphaerae]GLI27427.1 ABC transporter substrate-binding protein [Agromyces rhizosphaerae]